MFLLPPALLVLDSFRSKYGLVFCVLVLFAYLFYASATMGGGLAGKHPSLEGNNDDLQNRTWGGIHSPGRFAAILGIHVEQRT